MFSLVQRFVNNRSFGALFSTSTKNNSNVSFSWKKLENSTPVDFSACRSVFSPQAESVMTLEGGNLYFLNVPSFQWSETDKVKGRLPRRCHQPLVVSDQLKVIGQNGLEKMALGLWSVALEQAEDDTRVFHALLEEATPPRFQWYKAVAPLSSQHPGRIYMFGETYNDEINQNPCSVAYYAPESESWVSVPDKENAAPEARMHLGVCTNTLQSDHEVYVFAPTEDRITYDTHVFDVNTNKWRFEETPVETNMPIAATGASFTTLGDYVVVFGGLRFGEFTNDLFVLDKRTKTWIDVPSRLESGDDAPTGRKSHAAIAIAQDQLVLFGGHHNRQPQDMWQFTIHQK